MIQSKQAREHTTGLPAKLVTGELIGDWLGREGRREGMTTSAKNHCHLLFPQINKNQLCCLMLLNYLLLEDI